MSQATLKSLLSMHFPAWISRPGNIERTDALTPEALEALMRLVMAETSGTPTFDQRDRYVNDLRCFDITLNQITSELIASRLACDTLGPGFTANEGFFFTASSPEELDGVVQPLLRDGYCRSSLSLTADQIAQLKDGLRCQKFSTKGPNPNTCSGIDLLACEASGHAAPLGDGDTYWLNDMDGLAHAPLFVKLAFDPYIISIASRYLGCPPVHVQTNAWFSFSGQPTKHNLSMNGQLFHQDKEFVKFFKAFIYLSDVGEEQGPHSYVEGSHHDELHRKGVSLSDRVTDADIGKYYDRSRIKTVTGTAGEILFGDTSCVHKGEALTRGMRIMLQLEYASSLYLSPVAPFSDFTTAGALLAQYPENFARRMLANYSSVQRQMYREFEAAPRPRPRLSSRLRGFAGRVKRRLTGSSN